MRDEKDKVLAARAKMVAAVHTLSRESLIELFEGLVAEGIYERVVEPDGQVRYQIRLGFEA